MSTFPDIRPLLPSWDIVETWAVRFFLFLGILTLLPWILLVLFDASLYVWRYLILAPITRFLHPSTYLPETPVVPRELAEVSTATLKTVGIRRRKSLERSEGAPVAKIDDGLDKAWRKDG